MISKTKLRLTGRQFKSLQSHLFPADGLEAVSLALCGISELKKEDACHRVLTLHKIVNIPHDACKIRHQNHVTWSIDLLRELLIEALETNFVIFKIHSHPNGYEKFSAIDDKTDEDLRESISGWLQRPESYVSAIMLPNGRMIARSFNKMGQAIPIDSVLIAGDDILLHFFDSVHIEMSEDDYRIRTEQSFGKGTQSLLSKLTIGIVGISGTGSPVTEMLYRLGIGKLVLIDADKVEGKNVGRIYNSTMADAEIKRSKVDVLEEAIKRSGLPTEVKTIAEDCYKIKVIQELAQCDIVFGCMDAVDGRELLNKLAVYYTIPYFDLGVHLKADGLGGVSFVYGHVQYLTPDGSTLLDRKAYTAKNLRESYIKRAHPEQYKGLVDEEYIEGAQENKPAVISLNTLIASLAVNDLLARLHLFRWFNNADVGIIRMNVSDLFLEYVPDPAPEKSSLMKFVGRGDTVPLVGERLLK